MPAFPQTSTPLLGVHSEELGLRPGVEGTIEITVDSSAGGEDLLSVMLGDRALRISLFLPNGTEITRETAARRGFTWEVMNRADSDDFLNPFVGGELTHLIVFGPNQPSGKYRIRVDGRDVKNETAARVVFFPMGNRDANTGDTVRVGLQADRLVYAPQDKITILAAVLEGNKPVQGASIRGGVVKSIDPQSAARVATLSFKGSGPGVYSAEFQAAEAGHFEVVVTIQGEYADGRSFEREAVTSVWVEPHRADILGYRHRAIDDDKNGLIDRLEVTTRVRVILPGRYHLNLRLAGSIDLTEGRSTANLAAGEQSTVITFTGPELYRLGEGPYRIEQAELFREEGVENGLATRITKPGYNIAIKRSELDRGKIYFTGDHRVATLRSNGTGAYDRFRVTYGVFTPGGQCFWSGGLESGNRELHALENGDGILQRGPAEITLDFDGHEIARHADGDVLKIAGAGINCNGFEASEGPGFETPVYPKGTFERISPSFEVRTKGTQYRFALGPKQTVYRAAPGDQVDVEVETPSTGIFYETVDLSLTGLPSGVEAVGFPPGMEARIHSFSFGLKVSKTANFGSYPLTIHADGKGIHETANIELSVDRELFEKKRADEQAAAAARLQSRKESASNAKFKREGRRPIHLVLLFDRTQSNPQECGAAKEAAIRFALQFQEGYDSVGVISYAAAATEDIPFSNSFRSSIETKLEKLGCAEPRNSVAAVNAAQQMLASSPEPNSLNAVVFVMNNLPDMVTARWPVRRQADRRYGFIEGPPGCQTMHQQCDMPASECPANVTDQDATVLISAWGAAIFAPNLIPEMRSRNQARPFQHGCTFAPGLVANGNQDLAYIPERDSWNVPFTGALEVKRFTAGPYSGKIRPDWTTTFQNAALNNLANHLASLRKTTKATTYVLALGPKLYIEPLVRPLANEPASANFDRAQPTGALAISLSHAQLQAAYDRISDAILVDSEKRP